MFATPPPTGPGTPPGVQPPSHQLPPQQALQAPLVGHDAAAQQATAWTQPAHVSGWAQSPAMPAAQPVRQVATQLTGAYAASGDAGIDRMLRFEAACKQFGSLQ
jgi:hypothetical protein